MNEETQMILQYMKKQAELTERMCELMNKQSEIQLKLADRIEQVKDALKILERNLIRF